jgi:hypothetical protein
LKDYVEEEPPSFQDVFVKPTKKDLEFPKDYSGKDLENVFTRLQLFANQTT